MPRGTAAHAAVGTAFVEVHVSTPDAGTATRLAHLLVHERLAGCVQVVPGVTSVYRWEGSVETAQEHLLLVKTTVAALPAIRARVGAEHPYETPEVLALPVLDVAPGYGTWLSASVDPGHVPGPPQTTEGQE